MEDGWTQVARKWYGITDAHLQPEHYGAPAGGSVETAPGSNVWRDGKDFLEVDQAFMDVIDNPRIADVAARVLVGPPDGTVLATGETDFWRPNRGVLRCTGASPRTYPPDADAEGYTYWHRDDQSPDREFTRCNAPAACLL